MNMVKIMVAVLFLLLPMTSGLCSLAHSGTTDKYTSWHMLKCGMGKLINIISACCGITYCNIKYTGTDSCNGKQTCNVHSSNNSIPVSQTNGYHIPYKYSIVNYDCRTESQLGTTRTRQGTTEVSEPSYTTRSRKITRSTSAKNNPTHIASIRFLQSTEWFIEKGTYGKLKTTHTDETNAMNYNYKQNTDNSVIVGSVVGSLLLIVLVVVVLVIFFKRKAVSILINIRFKNSPKDSNPVSETPTDGGLSNVELRNDVTPGYAISNECYHVHITRKHDVTCYNLKQMDNYSHLHGVNTNNIRIDDRSDGGYNHLGEVSNDDHYNYLNGIKNRTSDEMTGADYNHLGDISNHGQYHQLNEFKKRPSDEMACADYNHLGDVSMDDNYHHLKDFKNRTSDERITHGVIDADYNHLANVLVENPAVDYNHICAANREVVRDDYDQIGEITNDADSHAVRKDAAYVNHGSNNKHCDDTQDHNMTCSDYINAGAVKSKLLH